MGIEIRLFLVIDAFSRLSGTLIACSAGLSLQLAKQLLDSTAAASGCGRGSVDAGVTAGPWRRLGKTPLTPRITRFLAPANTYLVYLGISTLWRKQRPLAIEAGGGGIRGRTILWQAFLSDVLNPKVALFFLALLPQFVDKDAPHPALQILLLGRTVSVIALPTNILIVCCADRITGSLRRNASVSLWLRKGLGLLFIALGLRIAAERI